MSQCKSQKKTGTKEWASKNVNDTRNCRHMCSYCYARKMALRYGRIASLDEWQHSVFVGAKNIPRNASVMYPSSHDILPEFITEHIATMWSILMRGNTLLIVSKPHLECIQKITAWLSGNGGIETGPMNRVPPKWKQKVEFRFTIGSLDSTVLKKYEPGAPAFEERLACLKLAFERGFKTSVSMEPYLTYEPYLLAATVSPWVTGEIWVGPWNYNPPAELKSMYSHGYMQDIHHDLLYSAVLSDADKQKIRFKNHFQEMLNIDARGRSLA